MGGRPDSILGVGGDGAADRLGGAELERGCYSGASMQDEELFQQALGLTTPWYVTGSEFDAALSRLDLLLDFKSEATFSCPECGATGCKPHDTVAKTWRHVNFFQHGAYLHAHTPRVRCARCGVRLVRVPWARPGSGFTLLFEALVMTYAKDMPVAALARLVGDTRMWRIIHHYVDEARADADFSGATRVGMDEKASKRGHNYLALFVDLDDSRLLFATETREAVRLPSSGRIWSGTAARPHRSRSSASTCGRRT